MAQDSNSPLYFECHLCGDCCSSWSIPLEGHKATKLLEKPWVHARLTETRRALEPLAEDLYRIPLTDENVCVFLADDRRCMVEVHEGLALKPKECQRFPFATVQLPDGSPRHEASAACKHISEALLLAFQPILPKPQPPETDSAFVYPQQDDAQFDEVCQLPARIPVAWRPAMDVTRYEHFLVEARTILTMPQLTAEAALHRIARSLAKRRPVKAFQSHPLMTHGVTMVFLRKPYRTMSWTSLLLGRTYHDPRVFGMPIALGESRAIPWHPAQDRLLKAFLFQVLQRKRLLANGASLMSLLAMAAVAALLVKWYAKTLAWMKQSDTIAEADVSGAIRLVERYYTGHQPRFLQRFTSRWKGWLLVKILLS